MRAQARASKLGFDWPEALDALPKVEEEAGELRAALRAARSSPSVGTDASVVQEVGDLLFAAVNVSRLAGVDPERALRSAVAKFERRFGEVERLARAAGLAMPGSSLDALDRLWEKVKAGESGRHEKGG